MVTVLTIVLAVLIVLNIWCIISAVKFKKDARRKLQERIDEFNKATDLHVVELEGAKHRVEEAISNSAVLKKLYEDLLQECEDYKKKHNPHAEHQGPAENEGPSVHTEHGDPANKPVTKLPMDKKPSAKKRVYTPKKK